jgi:hypothetical protein
VHLLAAEEVTERPNTPFLRKVEYPKGGKIGKISTVFRVASIDARAHRDMIDK